MTRATMTCPKCGAQMNHQADKIVYPTTQGDVATGDFDGILERVFACPNCGWIDSRRDTGDIAASA